MKDSNGQEYDGWVMRMPDEWGGDLVAYSFARTREELGNDWLEGRLLFRLRRNQMRIDRQEGFRPTKVRLVPVEV